MVTKAELMEERKFERYKVDWRYKNPSRIRRILKDILDPGDVDALEIDDVPLMLSWCALGVPFADLHLAMAWCAFWCALELDGMHEDPNLVERIHKYLLDPGHSCFMWN